MFSYHNYKVVPDTFQNESRDQKVDTNNSELIWWETDLGGTPEAKINTVLNDLDVNVNWQKNILEQMKSYDYNDSHDGSQIWSIKPKQNIKLSLAKPQVVSAHDRFDR